MANKIQLTLFGQGSHSAIPFNPQALVKILNNLREDEVVDLCVEQDPQRHGEWLLEVAVRGGPRDRQVIGRTGE